MEKREIKITPDVVTIQDILLKQGIEPDLATQATEVLAEYWEVLCQVQTVAVQEI